VGNRTVGPLHAFGPMGEVITGDGSRFRQRRLSTSSAGLQIPEMVKFCKDDSSETLELDTSAPISVNGYSP
jgi:hypothetical protein